MFQQARWSYWNKKMTSEKPWKEEILAKRTIWICADKTNDCDLPDTQDFSSILFVLFPFPDKTNSKWRQSDKEGKFQTYFSLPDRRTVKKWSEEVYLVRAGYSEGWDGWSVVLRPTLNLDLVFVVQNRANNACFPPETKWRTGLPMDVKCNVDQ